VPEGRGEGLNTIRQPIPSHHGHFTGCVSMISGRGSVTSNSQPKRKRTVLGVTST
jgi:hypothetical protein